MKEFKYTAGKHSNVDYIKEVNLKDVINDINDSIKGIPEYIDFIIDYNRPDQENYIKQSIYNTVHNDMIKIRILSFFDEKIANKMYQYLLEQEKLANKYLNKYLDLWK